MDRIIPALCQSIENGEWETVFNPYCLEQTRFKHVSKEVMLNVTQDLIQIDGIDIGFHNYTRVEEAFRQRCETVHRKAKAEKLKRDQERASQLILLFPPLEKQQ